VVRFTLALLLAASCGPPAEDPPPCVAPTQAFTADGEELLAGASAYCQPGPHPAPDGAAGWREIFVAEGGGGDGSRGAPLGTLSAAIDAAGGEAAVIHLGPGSFEGAAAAGPLAIVGSGGAFTTVRGGLSAAGTEALFVSHLSGGFQRRPG
jgi:hypothetical protein